MNQTEAIIRLVQKVQTLEKRQERLQVDFQVALGVLTVLFMILGSK
jgi:hypothetical protein